MTDVLDAKTERKLDTKKIRRDLANRVLGKNKTIWQTEYGDDDKRGVYLARSIISDINHMAVSAWFYWQPIEPWTEWGFFQTFYASNADEYSSPVSKDKIGTIYGINNKAWAMAHFSRFIRPGATIYTQDSDHAVLAKNQGSDAYTVVIYKDESLSYLEVVLPETATESTLNLRISSQSRVSNLHWEKGVILNTDNLWQPLEDREVDFSLVDGKLQIDLSKADGKHLYSIELAPSR